MPGWTTQKAISDPKAVSFLSFRTFSPSLTDYEEMKMRWPDKQSKSLLASFLLLIGLLTNACGEKAGGDLLPVELVSISIFPGTATVKAGESKTFTATVTGNANKAVDFSVQEGVSAGTITAGGVYTAPTTAGTYHVVATSHVDPTKSATAIVTVTAINFLLTVTPAGAGSGTVISLPAGINCGNTCSASYNSGTSVTLTATSALGSLFTGWTGGGCSGTGTCMVTMNAAYFITATFHPQPFDLTVTPEGAGSGTVTSLPAGIHCGNTCSASYNFGTAVTLTATAALGSIFTGWTGRDCSGTSACIVTMNATQFITATFHPPEPFTKVPGFNNDVYAIAPAGDGTRDIYVGGFFTTYNSMGSNRIIRLNADGSVDTAFAVGSGFNNYVNTIVPSKDGTGDIYVGGLFTTYNSTGSNNGIIRLNADGSADTAFAIGTGFDKEVLTIAPAGDGTGDIYVGGLFNTYKGAGSNKIIRLNADGSVDAAFSVGTGFDSDVYGMAPAGDGSGDIYVGGLFTTYKGAESNNGIIRLNADGSLDVAFSVGTGFDSDVYGIAPAGDGSGDIYVGGLFTTYKGAGSNKIIRLNADGSADTAFAVGSGLNSDAVSTIAPAGDGSGDSYVGGFFSITSTPITRLNADGSADTAFAVGTGFNNTVRTIVPSGDGSGDIYVGGDFTTYSAATVDRIARLAINGTVR